MFMWMCEDIYQYENQYTNITTKDGTTSVATTWADQKKESKFLFLPSFVRDGMMSSLALYVIYLKARFLKSFQFRCNKKINRIWKSFWEK